MLGGAEAAEGGDKLIVIAELVSKPDRADDLRNIMVPFVEGARKEPGCEHYILCEDRKTPGRFLTYEVWTDEAAIAAHMQTPAIKEAGPKLADILAKPFTQAMLKVLSAS
jgi:quinol monooxygenase YgiN